MNRIAGCPWKYGSVIAKRPLNGTEVDEFTVKVKTVGSGLRIGVTARSDEKNIYGDTADSWAIESVHGNVGHRARWKRHSKQLAKGDTVTV